MTRYAVGDLQGCLQPLQQLLQQVAFNPEQDQLWLVGDLINRGPESLATLRYIKQLGSCCRIVLGNHDLHFLAVAAGATTASKSDTFDDIFNAPDCSQLTHWLQQQPLFYSDPSADYHMVHAGIPPQWSIDDTACYAREVETVLQSEQANDFLNTMYGNKPDQWDEQLQGTTRLRVITNYLTRMRFCNAEGVLDFKHKLLSIDRQDFAPWFSFKHRRSLNQSIIFGHWAALEGNTDGAHSQNVYALDTGYVWGRSMTLMNLDNKQRYQYPCS